MLDEIGLEDERLNLSLTEDNLDIGYLPYHLSLGDREIIGLNKI
jgi:hypothetical protein